MNKRFSAEQLDRIKQWQSIKMMNQLIKNQLKNEQAELKSRNQELTELKKIEQISRYTCVRQDEMTLRQPEEAPVISQQLIERIQQYNAAIKQSKKAFKQKKKAKQANQQGKKNKRKVRTTITQQKLNEMNKIFKQAVLLKELNQQQYSQDQIARCKQLSQKHISQLKEIGGKLGLGYSTILHKFRQFKATKRVRGGALIQASNQKRRYKKTQQTQQIIQNALSKRTFYTAVQLMNYITQTYNRPISRSVVSRHLGGFGCSSKSSKQKLQKVNSQQLKQIRQNYIKAFIYYRNHKKANVFFIDELNVVAQQPNNQGKKVYSNQILKSPSMQSVVTLMASQYGEHVHCQISQQNLNCNKFLQFMKTCLKQIQKNHLFASFNIIVMDLQNKSHISSEIQKLREELSHNKPPILIFYLPPYSSKLNFVRQILSNLDFYIKLNQYKDLEQFERAIRYHLKLIFGDGKLMQQFKIQSQIFLHKALKQQSF